MSVPQDYPDRPVAVIGAGTLGRRLALMFATRGGFVRINARRAEHGAAAVDFVEQQIGGLSGTHPRWWARGRAEYVARLQDAVAGAWLVIESVPERLELKAGNLCAIRVRRPARRDPLVELLIVCKSIDRDWSVDNRPDAQYALLHALAATPLREMLDFVSETFPEYGLRPVLVRRESTGFIFNGIWAAIKREALDVVAGGVCMPHDVDEMWKLMFGTEIRPFPCDGPGRPRRRLRHRRALCRGKPDAASRLAKSTAPLP